jgi:methylglutaconyl-CoA hydratase
MPESYVTTKTKNGIATITFFTLEHNALPTAILLKLEEAFIQAGTDDAVKVIILKSDGNRTFCAGASFIELIAIENIADGKVFFMGFAKVILAMRNCGKIIIARVQGKAVGGGVGLAAAADYCFATQYASIKLSEISIGIGPFVIAPAVERKIGNSALTELTLNAHRFYEPGWANEKGLFHEVFDHTEEMDAAITALAEKLASYNPEALKTSKIIFWEKTENWPKLLEKRAEMSGNLVVSEFTKKALERFGK